MANTLSNGFPQQQLVVVVFLILFTVNSNDIWITSSQKELLFNCYNANINSLRFDINQINVDMHCTSTHTHTLAHTYACMYGCMAKKDRRTYTQKSKHLADQWTIQPNLRNRKQPRNIYWQLGVMFICHPSLSFVIPFARHAKFMDFGSSVRLFGSRFALFKLGK